MAGTNVTEKNQTEISTIMADMAEFAGEGMDIITADDMQIPFVRILQALSPERTTPSLLRGHPPVTSLTP